MEIKITGDVNDIALLMLAIMASGETEAETVKCKEPLYAPPYEILFSNKKAGSRELPEGFEVKDDSQAVQYLAREIAECLRRRGQSQSPERPEE